MSQENSSLQRRPEPDRCIHLAVMYDGEVIWKAPRQPRITLYEADLITLNVEGSHLLEVWKERYGLVPRGAMLTPFQAGLLAAAYVVLSGQARPDIIDQRDVLDEIRRQLGSSMKLLGE